MPVIFGMLVLLPWRVPILYKRLQKLDKVRQIAEDKELLQEMKKQKFMEEAKIDSLDDIDESKPTTYKLRKNSGRDFDDTIKNW